MRISDRRSPSHDPKLTTQRGTTGRIAVFWGTILCLLLSAPALMQGQTPPNPQVSTASPLATAHEAGESLPKIIAPVIIQLPDGVGWDTWPRQARARFVPVQIPVGTSFDDGTLLGPAWRLVWPNHPEVVVFLIGDGVFLDTYVIPAVGPDPGPTPGPDPVPPIPDPPPLPVALTEVVIVRQTETTSTEQVKVILSTEWRKVLDDAEIPFQVLDQDQLPERLKPLAARAANNPVVFLIAGDVAEAVMVPLPDSIEGLTQLVKEKTK